MLNKKKAGNIPPFLYDRLRFNNFHGKDSGEFMNFSASSTDRQIT